MPEIINLNCSEASYSPNSSLVLLFALTGLNHCWTGIMIQWAFLFVCVCFCLFVCCCCFAITISKAPKGFGKAKGSYGEHQNLKGSGNKILIHLNWLFPVTISGLLFGASLYLKIKKQANTSLGFKCLLHCHL